MTGVDSHNLDLLSHSVEVNERSGGQGDVGVEQQTLGSSIDGAEDSALQRESEGEFVSILGVREDVLGVNPVLRSLGKKIAVLWKLSGAQVTRVSSCQTESKAANVGALSLKNSHNQALARLEG